ncbi:hypothetical protein FNAPI_1963 [Fusarium napiforme]|uniref:DUF6594 domain-containing protein n=1 Tax=Fusarium napiforme TaxID=42672 RepID=A0A8H5JZP0_9HYPO|nr:hypothetical protein FNAPI_1963 [Fusarium napiforme]
MTTQRTSSHNIELGGSLPAVPRQSILQRLQRRSRSVNPQKQAQVESFPDGYPRFSALQSSHKYFHIFRRFEHLRMRLLLAKQDRLSILEKRLNKIDREEPAPVFLSSMRMNGSPERAAIISEIEDALESYDDLLERTEKVVSYDEPLDVHITSLQNWLRGNSCIAQDEMSFLQMKDDLLVLAPLEDGVLYWLETAVTSIIGFFGNAIDLISASATYLTVLIVFLNGPSGS